MNSRTPPTSKLLTHSYQCIYARHNFFRIDLVFRDQLNVKAQALQLADQHVERLGNAGLEIGHALDDRFVDLRTSGDIIGFAGQKLLQDVRGTVGLKCPDLHLTETLSAEL